MTQKLKFSPHYLVCPACFELLTREDIEGFGHCPYCDHAFELNAALENFLLGPVVQQWLRQTHVTEDGDGLL